MQDVQLFFLGIGGIGMSALARWYRHHGATVAGHDRTETALTRALVEEGIPVDTSGDRSALPASLLADLDAGRTDRWTVIRTPAVPDDFPLLALLRDAGFPVLKRAELLGKLTADRPLLAVAGTHGKTTTSTLLAHLLHQDGTPVDAFLGGIARSTGSNLLLAEAAGKEGPAPWTVVEADEFDRSFLTLHPTHAVITSADADHLDIYGTEQALHAAMVEFGRQVGPGGLILHEAVAAAFTATGHTPPDHTCYGALSARTDLPEGWEGGHSAPSGSAGDCTFQLHLTGHDPVAIRWSMPGAHNAANATAAAILAARAGLSPASIACGLASFPGIARRFEVRHDSPSLTVIDDYAHHPSEIASTIAAARSAYAGRRLVGVFQPHLFSRTRDFLDEFASALSELDLCILLPIYAAREEPLPGVDAQAVGEKMVECPVKCPEESRFLDVLETCDPDVLLFMGAGDLDQWIPRAIDRLSASTSTRETTPQP